jgi:hypothetical protein
MSEIETQIQRELLNTLVSQVKERIKEVQQEKKEAYSQEDVYIKQGIENELISWKISLEKWRKKLRFKDYNEEISLHIYGAIEKLRKSFGGTDVKLISEKMYRIAPDEFTPLGKLGVDIEIMGIKTFLGCESAAEDIACTPYGQMLADEFVATVIRTSFPDKFKL